MAHAHLIIIPQQGPHHLTSDRFAQVVHDQVVVNMIHVPTVESATLDDHARLLFLTGGDSCDAGD